jgi:hypothetical protein
MQFARFSQELTDAAGFADKRSKIGLRADGTQLVRLAGADMAELRWHATGRDTHKCVDCHDYGSWAEPLELSHDVPRGRGGSDVLENVHMRCRTCHRKRDNNSVKWGSQKDTV